MPELRELFRMATQKVDQDDGALERQLERQRKVARNRRGGVFVTVALLVVAAFAVFALSRGGTEATPAEPNPPSLTPGTTPQAYGSTVNLDTGEITPLPLSLEATGARYYAVSPDHTRVAYSSCCLTDNPLYTANLDGTGIRRVTPAGEDAYGAQWSPDGSLLVYQQRDQSTRKLGNLFTMNVVTGQQTRITNLDQSRSWGWWFTFPSFAADGRSILFQLPRGDNSNTAWDLWTVPVAGGKQSRVARDAGWGGLKYGSTSTSRNFAYLSPMNANFSGGALWLTALDPRGARPRALVRGWKLGWPRWSPDGTRISYSDGQSIYVLNVVTGATSGETRRVAYGGNAEWLDDHTLILGER